MHRQAWYSAQCEQLFGSPYDPSDLQFTTFTYGSTSNTLLAASNVIYVSSNADPYLELQLWYGVTSALAHAFLNRQGGETNDAFPNQRLITLDEGTPSLERCG